MIERGEGRRRGASLALTKIQMPALVLARYTNPI